MNKNSCYIKCKPTFQADALSTETKMGNIYDTNIILYIIMAISVVTKDVN